MTENKESEILECESSCSSFLSNYSMFALLFIVILGIGIRIYYFEGIDFDGSMYALQAKSILEGTYNIYDLHYYDQGVRYSILLPLALVYRLFGITELSTISLVFIASTLQIFFVYFFGKTLFNKHVGLIAAFLLAIFPIDVNNATILEADIIISLITSFSVFLFYQGYKKGRDYYFFISGLLLGFAFFAKIFSVLIFGVFLLYEIFFTKNLKKSFKTALFVVAGFIIITMPYFLYFYTSTGDILYYYHQQSEVNDQWIKLGELRSDLTYYPLNMILVSQGEEPPMFGIYFILLFIAVLYYARKKDVETRLLIVWFFILLMPLAGFPHIPKVQRYLILLEIPLILLISRMLYDFATSTISKPMKVISLVALSLIIVATNFSQYGTYDTFNTTVTFKGKEVLHEEKSVYLSLKDLPEKDVYITHYSELALLNFYFSYSKNSSTLYGYRGSTATSFFDLHYVRDINQIHDSYLLLDKRYLKQDLDRFGWYAETDGSLEWFTITQVPETWHVILGIGNETTTHTALFYVE